LGGNFSGTHNKANKRRGDFTFSVVTLKKRLKYKSNRYRKAFQAKKLFELCRAG